MFSDYIEYISQNYTDSLGCTFISEMGENYFFSLWNVWNYNLFDHIYHSNLFDLNYFRLFCSLQIDNVNKGKEP